MARRLKGFLVTPELVGSLLRAGERSIKVDSPLPTDAQFFSAYFKDEWRSFIAVFEHESFPVLPEGCALQVSDVQIEVTDLANQ